MVAVLFVRIGGRWGELSGKKSRKKSHRQLPSVVSLSANCLKEEESGEGKGIAAESATTADKIIE